ncbi:MAG TPA: hypothetical protein PL072_10115 [Phycisphaerales bacterium]|nr:hypothetical protein [Phycisphaerales bacterium]
MKNRNTTSMSLRRGRPCRRAGAGFEAMQALEARALLDGAAAGTPAQIPHERALEAADLIALGSELHTLTGAPADPWIEQWFPGSADECVIDPAYEQDPTLTDADIYAFHDEPLRPGAVTVTSSVGVERPGATAAGASGAPGAAPSSGTAPSAASGAGAHSVLTGGSGVSWISAGSAGGERSENGTTALYRWAH